MTIHILRSSAFQEASTEDFAAAERDVKLGKMDTDVKASAEYNYQIAFNAFTGRKRRAELQFRC